MYSGFMLKEVISIQSWVQFHCSSTKVALKPFQHVFSPKNCNVVMKEASVLLEYSKTPMNMYLHENLLQNVFLLCQLFINFKY
ncbi:Protein of unknown function [Gryllus bimaculatus]|nr:Protein of unknown function [Gryllus bimaculatus]